MARESRISREAHSRSFAARFLAIMMKVIIQTLPKTRILAMVGESPTIASSRSLTAQSQIIRHLETGVAFRMIKTRRVPSSTVRFLVTKLVEVVVEFLTLEVVSRSTIPLFQV